MLKNIYVIANLSAIVCGLMGAYKAFRHAPHGQRWVGAAVVASWGFVAVAVPYSLRIAMEHGAIFSVETIFLLLTILFAGVALFGLFAFKRYYA
jgi:hypothetical protein